MMRSRKFWVILAVFAVLGAGAAWILPQFLNVDRYRPWVVEQVNRQIHGRFELGHLDLTLWGRLAVRADGAKLMDADGKPVLTVPRLELRWPWSSLWKGAPELSLHLQAPQINLVKNAQGKWNAATLLPDSAPAPVTPPESKAGLAVPALVLKSKLSVEIVDAKIRAGTFQLPELDLSLKELSLSQPFSFSAQLRLAQADAEGLLRLRGQVSGQDGFTHGQPAKVQLTVDATDLTFAQAGVFLKPAKDPLTVETKLGVSQAQLLLTELAVRSNGLDLGAQGSLDFEPQSQLNLKVASKTLDLGLLSRWVKLADLSQVQGKLAVQASLSGPIEKLKGQASFSGQGLSAQTSALKALKLHQPPTLDFALTGSLDRVELKEAKLRYVKDAASAKNPSEVVLKGSVSRFYPKPDGLQGDLTVSSAAVDLDALGLLAGGAAVGAAETAKEKPKGAAKTDADAQWLALAQTPWMKTAQLKLQVSVGQLRAAQTLISDFILKAAVGRGQARLEELRLKAFEGQLRAQGQLTSKGKSPWLSFGAEINQLNLKKAAESQMQLFKNTLEGKLETRFDGTSPTLRSDEFLQKAQMRGGFKVKDGRFSSIDISKLVVTRVNQALEKAAANVQQLRDKRVQDLPERASFYESISSDFELKDGVIRSPQLLAKPMPNAGIQLQGPYSVTLVDQSVKADWTLSDPYNVLHVADWSVQVMGQDVPQVLVEPGKSFQVPLELGCKLDSPCVQSERIVGHLTQVATANLGRAMARGAQKQAGDQIKKLIPGLGDGIKKFW